MPRGSRASHFYLKGRRDGAGVWYIRDGQRRISTTCGTDEIEGAERALESYQGGEGTVADLPMADVRIWYVEPPRETVRGLSGVSVRCGFGKRSLPTNS